jgi:quercetin dioxygenase-like cupin family protein
LSVREGRVRFTTVEATVEAGPDELIACDPGVPHSVEAVTDAICLLHLTGAS